MIHPSYTELIEAINREAEEGDTDTVLNSRYSLVLATSKRARQLIAGAKPLVKGASGKKPLSVAIEELYQGKVKILPPKEEEEILTQDDHPTHPGIEGYNTSYFEEDTEGYDDEASGDEDYDDEYKDSEEDEDRSMDDVYLGEDSEEDD